MKKYPTDAIRNVALVSHGGAGKTSLTEALLFSTGAINRLGSIEAGNTTTDYDPDEIKRQVTINAALAPLEWGGAKINIIDTPGYFDFIGDTLSSLRVADSVAVVVCAVSGVEVGTEKVWSYADEFNLPRLVFINKIDRENANFKGTVEQLQKFFGHTVVPVQLPLGQEAQFEGVVDLVEMKAITFSGDGLKPQLKEIPENLRSEAESCREKLVEAVAEVDDDLLMKYLEGEPLEQEEVRRALAQGILERKVIP
ncbi:MAG: GTP-binding protein, partial [Dethiobacteria bacterium]